MGVAAIDSKSTEEGKVLVAGVTGISIAAIQKLLDQLIQKKYVERGEKGGSWRVFVTQ